ncbi:MAG: chorismate synthase, partial [Eubacteriales bacterium]
MTSYGKNIKIEVFGGSHDSEIGIKAEGIPAGITVDTERLNKFMQRRAPGQSKLTTSRKEPDVPEFVSGFDGSTTNGEPL